MITDNLPRPVHEGGETRFAEVFAEPIVSNNAWRLATLFLTACVFGLIACMWFLMTHTQERVVVRIDDIGRAQALGFTADIYTPREPEVKYFLTHFVSDYYSRQPVTILTDYERALLFLNVPLAEARRNEERRTKEIEKFIVNGSDEIGVEVDNIVLTNMERAPYAAQVDIEKVYRDRLHNETRREKFTVSIAFAFAKQIPNDVIKVNPLGFTVMSVREDQHFK